MNTRNATIDLTTRGFGLRTATVNEEARSVEAVIATEEPVTVMDWRRWEPIDEVLRMDGVKLPRQLPLLDSHSRWGTGSVLGSTRELRIEGNQLVGRNFFSKLAEDQWTKVREGHITDNSVGYRVLAYEDIPPGKSATVKGRTYTAGPRTLRISTEWQPHENSLVPIGADQMAKMREEFRGHAVPADSKEAHMSNTKTEEARGQETQEPTREQPTQVAPTVDAAKVAADAVAADRKRGVDIRKEADGLGIDDAVIRQAIDEGKSVDEARAMFLKHVRDSRSKSVGSPSPESRTDAEVIETALALSTGIDQRKIADTIPADRRERVMNQATDARMRGYGLHCLMDAVIDGGGRHYSGSRKSDSFIRAALDAERAIRSGGFTTLSLSGVLANVANKAMIASYNAVEVVWPQICAVRNHADFKVHTRYRLDSTGAFKKVAADGELKHIGLTDASYTNQLVTYGAIISLTRQMMINDDMGAFMEIPTIIGRMSALRVEEAVFVLLLSNPSNFFHANNANYLSGASSPLSIASLAAAEKKFMDFVSDGKPVLVSPTKILVGTTLKGDAQNIFDEKVILASGLASTASKTLEPAKNKMFNKYPPVASPYVDNTAIKDQDGAAITGQSSTAWWMFADPAVRAAIAVAFLNGQQTPTIESADTEFSTLGMQWRGYHDFGVGMEETTAAVMSAGA